jgi:parallel beta-helix repeat protein
MITFHDNPNNFDSELVDILSVNNVTIRDNIIQQNQIEFGSDRGGVILRNSSYCFIQNNSIIKVDDPRPCWGVVLMDGSTFINVSGNEIYNYSGGILIWSSSDSVIYMNYLHHNCFGINSIFGNNNHIISNIINFNWNGIKFDVSCNNVVSGNIITDNGEGDDVTLYYGIGLFISSDNYFSYNHISNNDPVGIYILSDRNNIRLNHISSNIIGVYCDHGSNNFISDNNFVLNEKNGYFEGVIYRIRRNIWKGNYWDEPRFRPYPIYGQGYFLFFSFKWFNFDWHPTQEPYDI